MIVGAALPAFVIVGFRLASPSDDYEGLATVLLLIAFGAFALLIGIGLSAGHLAARFDPERPRLSAAIAATLASAALLAFFDGWSGAGSLLGMLTLAIITISVAVIVAGYRARSLEK